MMMQLELLFEDDPKQYRRPDAGPAKSAKVRRLKIQHGPYRNGRDSFPMLRLHGKWLLQAGFTVGDVATVEVREGVLTIRRITV